MHRRTARSCSPLPPSPQQCGGCFSRAAASETVLRPAFFCVPERVFAVALTALSGGCYVRRGFPGRGFAWPPPSEFFCTSTQDTENRFWHPLPGRDGPHSRRGQSGRSPEGRNGCYSLLGIRAGVYTHVQQLDEH